MDGSLTGCSATTAVVMDLLSPPPIPLTALLGSGGEDGQGEGHMDTGES